MKGSVHYEVEFRPTSRCSWRVLRGPFGSVLAFVDEDQASRHSETLQGVHKVRVVRVTREPQRAVKP